MRIVLPLLQVGGVVSLLLFLTACAGPAVYPAGDRVDAPLLTPVYFRTGDGVNLPYRTWVPDDNTPQAIIVAVHGFNDYSRFFERPGEYLAAKGVQSYAYDQRGFGQAPNVGLWAGGETYRQDLASFTQLVRQRHPGVPTYILGESFGGAVVVTSMIGDRPPDVDGVILSAPAVWGRVSMSWYEKAALWLSSHTVPWLTVTGRGLNIKPSDNIPMLIDLGRDPLVIKGTRVEAIHGLVDLMDKAYSAAPAFDAQALILYGAKDEIIPGQPTYSFIRRLPTLAEGLQTFALYPSGYHMLLRDLNAMDVLDDIAAWVRHPDGLRSRQRLPSGADVDAEMRLSKWARR